LRVLKAALPAWRKTQHRLVDAIGAQTAASLRKLAGGPCSMELPPSQPARDRRKPVSKSRRAIRHRDGHPAKA
jgi:hypothetical protein